MMLSEASILDCILVISAFNVEHDGGRFAQLLHHHIWQVAVVWISPLQHINDIPAARRHLLQFSQRLKQ